MAIPLAAAAPVVLELGKGALKEFQKPIIGYKITRTRKNGVVEKSVQVTGWQLMAAGLLGLLGYVIYTQANPKGTSNMPALPSVGLLQPLVDFSQGMVDWGKNWSNPVLPQPFPGWTWWK